MNFRSVIKRARGTARAGIVARLCAAAALGALAPVLRAQAGSQAGSQALPALPKTPVVPTTFAGLFAARDARASESLGYLRCLSGTVGALRAGALGGVPREWSMTCVRQGREWRGVFGQLTDDGILVRLQYAFRGARGDRGVLTRDPIDTSVVNGTARALLRGLSAPLPGAGRFEFTPVPLPQDKFIEVWFLPMASTPVRAVVGGDSLIQMSADGSRELGHGRTTPPIRTVSVPLEGARWTLASSEDRLPTVSELLIAHMAIDLVPEVRVVTRQYESILTRGRPGWTHRKR